MRRWQSWRVRKEEPYKAVPYLDLLGRNEGARRTRLIVRGALALLLVGGAFLLQDLYRTGAALQEDVDRAETRLENARKAFGAAQLEVEGLKGQIQQLRQQAQERETGQQRVQWQPALAVLRDLRSEGVTFRSLESGAGGALTLVAIATEGAPLSRLQISLQEAGLPFELRTVQWKRREAETVMTVTLRLQGAP